MTDTPSIPPALTEAEWRESQTTVRGPLDDIMTDDDGYIRPLKPDRLHAIAAVALYGQPFGFTQEECEAIYILCTPMAGGREGLELLRVAELALSAAAKIRSLLPPK